MPKVSVVIPTYNRENLLPETIESVLAQTYRDFEIIVIDDGSTDNTREVISAFPIRYFYQENQGAAAAQNKGAELSGVNMLPSSARTISGSVISWSARLRCWISIPAWVLSTGRCT